jgi:hypothetical protein
LLTISKERPVLIALARAGRNPTACGIFAHPASPWNTAYLLYDQLSRREIILHSAAIAVRQVAAYLANEESVPAIREIVFKIDVRDFIVWYESEGEERWATPRTAALLRDLDDACALVGECGEYRPDLNFVRPVPFHGKQSAANLAMHLLRHHGNSKSYSCDFSSRLIQSADVCYVGSFELPIR